MDSAEEWCTISRALQIITSELRTSVGRAQARLIEACAAGSVRSRVPRLTRLLGDESGMGLALANFISRAGPVSHLIWRGAAIDGDALLDRSRSRWSPVEINVADLRSDLAGAEPVAPATVSARVVSEKGGRPTDELRVKAEAERRLNSSRYPRPPSLAAFARDLHGWLDAQPDAIRVSITGKVMSPETIENHVRTLWTEYRNKKH